MHKKISKLALWLGISAILLPVVTQAQKKQKAKKTKEDQYSYTIERNEPDKAKNLHFLLSPVYFDLYAPNINLGYELSVDYTYTNTFKVYAQYQKSYFDITQTTSFSNNGAGVPANGSQTFSDFEFGGEYYFFGRTYDINEHMVYEHAGGNYYTEIYHYRRIPAKIQRMFGVRVADQSFNTIVSGSQLDFTGYGANDPSKTPIDLGAYSGVYSTMLHVNVLSIGLSMTTIHDLRMTYKNYGPSNTMSFNDIYADLLYATSIRYDDMSWNPDYANGFIPSLLVVSPNVPVSRLGFRAGVTFDNLNTAGYGYNIEGGIRPGINSALGFYFLVKFDFALNFKLLQQPATGE